MKGLNNLVYHFAIPQETLPWQPIVDAKLAKLVTYLHSLCWHSEMDCAISQFQFQEIKWYDFFSLCRNLVRFALACNVRGLKRRRCDHQSPSCAHLLIAPRRVARRMHSNSTAVHTKNGSRELVSCQAPLLAYNIWSNKPKPNLPPIPGNTLHAIAHYIKMQFITPDVHCHFLVTSTLSDVIFSS